MSQNPRDFSVENNGSVTLGGSGGSQNAVTTNVSIWYPERPGAFEKARDAKIFTRLETLQSHDQFKASLDSASEVNQTFCTSVNNVLVTFSTTREEQTAHVKTLREMLQANSMKINAKKSVFHAENCADAGIELPRRLD